MLDFSSFFTHVYILLAIIFLISMRHKIYAVIFPQKHIINEFIRALPFIDPDSNRMIEMISFKRFKDGLSTATGQLPISSNVEVTMQELIDIATPYFDTSYRSDYLYRAISVKGAWSPVPHLYMVIEFTMHSRNVYVFGDPEQVEKVIDIYRTKFIEPKSITVTSVLGVSENGFITEESQILENKVKKALDVFYPFIDGGIEQLAKDFEESPANTLILIGPWGTGKTTLIRTLMLLIHKTHYGVVNSTTALKDQSLIAWMKGLGSNSLIATEDSDELVMAREDGNYQMAGLLNALDGIIPSDSKLIISTNLQNGVNRIDPALVRPGRTFKVIQFRSLTLLEANNVRERLQLPPIIASSYSERFTLSEAINWSNDITGQAPERVFGLVPNN